MGRRGPAGVDALVGTYVHLVLEGLMGLPAGERSVEAAKRLLLECWPEVVANAEWVALGYAAESEEVRTFRRRAWAGVRGYFEIEDPDRVQVVAREQYVSAVVEGVPLRGIIDRVDRDVFDDLVVSDYKTGKVPAPMFRGGKLRQLALYAAVLGEVEGRLPAEGRLLFTTFGKVVSASVTAESVAVAVEVAGDAWDGLQLAESGAGYRAQPGPLCGWCPFVGECDAGLAEVRERLAAGKLKKSAPAYALAAQVEG